MQGNPYQPEVDFNSDNPPLAGVDANYEVDGESYQVVQYSLIATEDTERTALERSLLTCKIDGDALVISDDEDAKVYLSEMLEHSFQLMVKPSVWEGYSEESILEVSYDGTPIMAIQYIIQ